MNVWDILIVALVLLAVAGAVKTLRKRKGGCSCGCGGCPGKCANPGNRSGNVGSVHTEERENGK